MALKTSGSSQALTRFIPVLLFLFLLFGFGTFYLFVNRAVINIPWGERFAQINFDNGINVFIPIKNNLDLYIHNFSNPQNISIAPLRGIRDTSAPSISFNTHPSQPQTTSYSPHAIFIVPANFEVKVGDKESLASNIAPLSNLTTQHPLLFSQGVYYSTYCWTDKSIKTDQTKDLTFACDPTHKYCQIENGDYIYTRNYLPSKDSISGTIELLSPDKIIKGLAVVLMRSDEKDSTRYGGFSLVRYTSDNTAYLFTAGDWGNNVESYKISFNNGTSERVDPPFNAGEDGRCNN